MDAQRESAWEEIVATMRRADRGGMLYLTREGQRMKSGWAAGWPDADEKDLREERLADLLGQLEKAQGSRTLYFLPEGAKDRQAWRWPWPAPVGLWTEVQAQSDQGKQNSVLVPTYRTGEEPAQSEVIVPCEEEEASTEVPYSRRLAEDIIALLEEVGKRMTLQELLEALAGKGISWSLRSLSATCPRMKEVGLLSNVQRPDARGRGYGLASWDIEDV